MAWNPEMLGDDPLKKLSEMSLAERLGLVSPGNQLSPMSPESMQNLASDNFIGMGDSGPQLGNMSGGLPPINVPPLNGPSVQPSFAPPAPKMGMGDLKQMDEPDLQSVIASMPKRPMAGPKPSGPPMQFAGLMPMLMGGAGQPGDDVPSTKIQGPETVINAKDPSMWGKGLEDSDLADAQKMAARQNLIANLGSAGSNMIATMSDTKSDPSFFDALRSEANKGPQNIKDLRKSKLETDALKQTALDKDPNSPQAQRLRASLKKVGFDPGPISMADWKDADGDIVKLAISSREKEKDRANDLVKERLHMDNEAKKAKASADKPTSDQSKAALFAARMEQAENNFSDLVKGGYDRTSRMDQMSRKIRPETAFSEGQRRQDQAERNYLNAVLRRESGAAISPSEFDSGEKQYFDRPGDTPMVREQKRKNRQLATMAMKAESGIAFDKIGGGKSSALSYTDPDKEKRYQEWKALQHK